MDKKLFRLDMSLAVEADDADEAFEILTTDETMKQIRKLILESRGTITELFAHEADDTPTIIN